MPEETDISSIGTVGISIGTAIIIVALISILLQSMRDDLTIVPDFQATYNRSGVRNQSLTWVANNTDISFNEGRVNTDTLLVYNNGSLIKSGNYTATESSIRFLNNTPVTGGGGDKLGLGTGTYITDKLNASFDYYYGSAARNATNQGLAAQNTLASFFPVVAIAAVGALIIGITLRYFRGRREGGNEEY